MTVEITEILLTAQSPDEETRTNAEIRLSELEEQSLAQFLLCLSLEISKEDKPLKSRIFAGTRFKNSLDVKEHVFKLKGWLSVESSVRSQIKTSLLSTLESSIHEVRDTAAQIIAKIAAKEIPKDEWPDLFTCLLGNMTKQASSKPASLNTLGYVCKEMYRIHLLQNEDKLVIRAVRDVMDDILKAVCEAAKAKEADSRKAAFEWIASVAPNYYEDLGDHVPTLLELTTDLIDEDNVPKAIEFWTGICEVEIKLIGDSHPHSHFINMARYELVPKLLKTLKKQGRNGVCKMSMAGGTCLGLVARAIGDSVLSLVMPFVQRNLSKCDGVSRGAGAYALGSILEGPNVEELSQMVLAVLHWLIDAVGDENSNVKETALWTIRRILKVLHSPPTGFSVISPAELERIIQVLVDSLRGSPHVSENFCGAIYYAAQGRYEGFKNGSAVLSPYLGYIITHLLTTTAERVDDSNDSKLRSAAAYTTLNEVVRCSNLSETSHIITYLLHQMMSKLRQTTEHQIQSPDSSGEEEEEEEEEDVQVSVCGVLQVIIQKLSSTDKTNRSVYEVVDEMMGLFIKVFDSGSSKEVHKQAMLATGALVCAIGPAFNKYMSEFVKYLKMGLQDSNEYQIFTISVGVVSDICRRVLADEMLPYCDDIMQLLLKNLSGGDLHQSVKPSVFTCFGDMAIAITKSFEKHVDPVMLKMKEAVEFCAQMDANDKNMVKYGKQLKMSILEGYSGILPVLTTVDGGLTLTRGQQLLEFIDMVVKDPHRDASLGNAAVSLLGDLATAVGPDVSVFNLQLKKTST